MADQATFVIDQGSDWIKVITLENDDGSVINLTGCEAHLQVRAYPESPTTVLDLSTAAGTLSINGSTGQISWDVPATQTAALSPSPGTASGFPQDGTIAPFGYYDLLVKWPNGQIEPYLSGQIVLKLGITHPF